MGRRRTNPVTEEMRAEACRLRGVEGLTCAVIAERLGISDSVASKLTRDVEGVKRRGTYHNVVRGSRKPKEEAGESAKAPRTSRYAHPPGHRETWGLLWQGTSMEEVDYPGG